MNSARTFITRFASSRMLLWIALALALPRRADAGGPELQSLFPRGGQRGRTIELTAQGKFARWPIDVWVDRAGLTVRAKEEKEKLTASIAEDALPGVYWLRLYDPEGTAPLVPFLVGDLAEAIEEEPNDSPTKPQRLPQAQMVVNGRLQRSGDVDVFAVDLKTGQTLVAAMTANQMLNSPVDAVLEVVSASGFVLAQNDDDRGLDPRVVFTAPSDGTYLVRTFGFPATPGSSISLAGGSNYVYRLTVTTGGYVDYTRPLALTAGTTNSIDLFGWNLPHDARHLTIAPANGLSQISLFQPGLAGNLTLPVESHRSILESRTSEQAEQAQAIELPVTVTGCIARPRETDIYSFAAKAGRQLICRVESGALGYPLDPVLTLLDAQRKSLARADDIGENRDAELSLAVPADGEYRLAITDLHRQGGERYVYRLRAGFAVPDFSLSLDADSIAGATGAQIEIPVKVERLAGFAEAITIQVEGLPPTISATTAVSAAEGESGKAVKLALSATHPYSGPIRIVGVSGGAAAIKRTAQAAIAGQSFRTSDLWLTITAAAKK